MDLLRIKERRIMSEEEQWGVPRKKSNNKKKPKVPLGWLLAVGK